MKFKILHIILLVFVISIGCKDEFLLETKDYKSYLVIDGMITNEPGPYSIKLTKSSPVSEYGEIPYEGCTITLFEKEGQSEILKEISPGNYQTSNELLERNTVYIY